VRTPFARCTNISVTSESVRKLDLFLYSVGGATDVPWRIVSMIREFATEFSVLVPYQSDECRHDDFARRGLRRDGTKGELGPIDSTATDCAAALRAVPFRNSKSPSKTSWLTCSS